MYHLISSYYTTDVCSVHFKSVHIYILRLRAAVCIVPRSGGDRGKRLNKKVKAQNYSAEESSESLELQSFMDIFIQMTFRDIRRLEIMIFSSN